MSQIEDDLNVAEYLERTGACTPADYIIIRLANEIRRIRQEPTEKMISVGMKWLSHWRYMRKSDQESSLRQAFNAMLKAANEK